MKEIVEIILQFFERPAPPVVFELFGMGGWMFFFYLLVFAGLEMTAHYKQERYIHHWKFVLLAIDIPALNVQTPKAVEQMFAHMYSVMEPPSIGFVYRRGFKQNYYSFEIVSIGGYIQFIIRTLDKYRDVVEAAVYAQYSDAEITEIEDYVTGFPDHYPNDTHDIFAADYALVNDQAFPLRLYQEFEHSISKDTVLKDPMGTILESFSRIGPGEQMWFQLIAEPIQESRWKKGAIKQIKKMIGEKEHSKELPFVKNIAKETKSNWEELSSQIFGTIRAEFHEEKHDDGPPNQLLYLSPGQRTIVEQMEDKIRKLGYRCKIRLVYVARKEVYNPARGVNSFTGAMNQFTIPSSNALLPKYLTATQYFFADQRKNYRRNVLMKGYKDRFIAAGKKPYVLNIEELATIWHFPMSHVKTPLVQKAIGKRAEAPVGLPVEILPSELPVLPTQGGASGEKAEAPRPQEYRTDSGHVIPNDNGKQFG